jgi:hypothetical protein
LFFFSIFGYINWAPFWEFFFWICRVALRLLYNYCGEYGSLVGLGLIFRTVSTASPVEQTASDAWLADDKMSTPSNLIILSHARALSWFNWYIILSWIQIEFINISISRNLIFWFKNKTNFDFEYTANLPFEILDLFVV